MSSDEGELSSPSKKSLVKEGVDDGNLTPIEKPDTDETNPDASKKSLFNFDFNQTVNQTVDTVKDFTEKVIEAIPFPNKEATKKPSSQEYQSLQKGNRPGDLNAFFAMYGQVTMKRETIKSQKKEADPALFDIEMEEDEFEEQAGLRNQEQHKNFGSFFTNKKIPKKYTTMSLKEMKIFKVEKENKKGGLMSFFKSSLKRLIGFHEGSMIVGELVDEITLKIKSKTHLERLFKLYTEKENSNEITLVFFNQQMDPIVPPVKKTYKFEEMDSFLKTLDEEITKCGGKLTLKHNPQTQ